MQLSGGAVVEITEPEIKRDEILVLKDDQFNPDNVCIVTGSGTGIGRATAIAAAANNLMTVGLDIDEIEGKKTQKMARDMGGQMIFIKTDLTKDEEKRLRQALTARDKRIKMGRANANKWREDRGYTLYPDLFSQTYADHLTPMVLLSMNTGLRRGEVFHLQWEDINFHTKTVTIHGGKAKNGHTRHIPLNTEALTTLENWGKKSKGLVFPNKDGNPLDNIKKAWSNHLKEANITNFRWHDLRHHFASRLVMAGVDLNTVRELLGHSDIKTTLRYAHLAPKHKAEAVEKILNI